MRVRAWTRRPARRLAILLAVLVVGGAVASHHAMPGMPAIGAAATCLAVLGSAVVAVGLIAPQRRLALRASDHRAPALRFVAAPRGVPARAGPVYLELLVLRR
jgi:hypothetical protein